MLWILAALFAPPAFVLALALWLWNRGGRRPLGNPDQPQSLDNEIARANLWGHPGPL